MTSKAIEAPGQAVQLVGGCPHQHAQVMAVILIKLTHELRRSGKGWARPPCAWAAARGVFLIVKNEG